MVILLSIIHYIVCLVLIIVILLQAGRGHGLAGGSFGSENTQSVFGTKTASFMNKATTFSAIAFLITSLSLGIINSAKSKSLMSNAQKKIDFPALPEGVKVTKVDGANKKVVLDTTNPKVDAALNKVEKDLASAEQKVKAVADATKK